MSAWRKLKYLLPSFRRAQNRDMQEELESLAAIAEPRELGNITRVAEDARAVWGWASLEQMYRDIRYALRCMRNSPGFTITAVLSLALGVGANSALFSLLDTVMFRNLPVHDPERLFFIENVGTKGNPNGAPPYPCFERIRDETHSFGGMAAFTSHDLNVSIDGNPEVVFGQFASGSYFNVLGVKPFLGRMMTADDEHLNPPVAVISHSYWHRRFGGDPGIIGKAISVGPRSVKVVGVTPVEFTGIQPGRMIDVTVPITLQNAALLHDKGGWNRVFRGRPVACQAGCTHRHPCARVYHWLDAVLSRTLWAPSRAERDSKRDVSNAQGFGFPCYSFPRANGYATASRDRAGRFLSRVACHGGTVSEDPGQPWPA
jgi:hypothetical protein